MFGRECGGKNELLSWGKRDIMSRKVYCSEPALTHLVNQGNRYAWLVSIR